MKNIFITASALALLIQLPHSCTGYVYGPSDSTRVAIKTYVPDAQHAMVYQLIGQILNTAHYNKIAIDDKLSSTLLDNYLDHLDPSKVYFLKDDINAFEKYRKTLDEGITQGNIQPAFDIYNVYVKRVEDRLNFTQDLLKTEFDFNQNDSFLTQRDSAAWPASFKDYDQLWRQKIKYECLLLKADGKDFKTYTDLMRKRYDNLRKQLGKTKNEDVFSVFANSLTEIADPHTNYFSPRLAEDFNMSMSLSLEGIGATLQTENEYTRVATLVKGGPAERSKLLFPNDKIVAVGQGKKGEMVSILDWRIDDVVAQIRGKKGTVVRLEIIPHDMPHTKTRIIELTRDKIVLEDQSAKSHVKDLQRNGTTYKIGVVQLPTFYLDVAGMQRGDTGYKSTTRDVRRLIEKLKADHIDALIMDLRGNGGGSLQEAIELSGLFIRSGPVVQVKNASGTVDVDEDRDPDVAWAGPMGVLVNRFSASASEIFAAAMQDYDRAVIIGEQTFGKGTVQNLVDLNQFIRMDDKKLGEVKITIAKFYRVSGGSTQHKGVIPDVRFPSLFTDDEFGEASSKFALPYDEISPATYEKVSDIDGKIPKLRQRHDERMKSNPEFTYLLQDIDATAKARKKMYATLNEARFKAEGEEAEKRKKERDEAHKALKEQKKETPDLILDEGKELVVDLIN